MPAAAIPALITAGGSIGAGIMGYKSAKAASTPSPVEKQAQQQQTAASTALSTQGGMLTNYGMPKLQQAGSYYSTLAGGNRAATAQALAPEVQNINDVYAGTQKTLARFLRGPERDMQLGELSRTRANSLASLFTGARQKGVEGLVNLGQYGTSQGTAALQGAAGVAGQVAGQGAENRIAGANVQGQAGASTAALIFQLLKAYGDRGVAGGRAAKVPSLPVFAGIPSNLPGAVG